MTLVRSRPDSVRTKERHPSVEAVEPEVPVTNATDRARNRATIGVIVTAWAFAVLPRAVQTLTAPKYRVNIGGEAIPYSPLAHRVVTLVTAAVFVGCLIPLLLSLRDIRTTGKVALAVYLMPWFYMVFRGLYQGQHIHRAQYVYPLIGLAMWSLRPKFKALAVLGYLAGATALLALFMGLTMPAKGIYQAATGSNITADKQIFSDGILVGPFTNGNNLGQFLVLGTVAAIMIRNQYWRVIMISACGLGLVWSSARSEIITFALIGVVFLIVRFTPPRPRLPLTFLLLTGMIVYIVQLPLTTKDPLAFTNRGYIWQVSLDAWHRKEWTGLGANFYQQIASQSATLGGSVFHGHNEFVQLLVTGGRYLALLIGLLMLVAIVYAARWARVGEFFPVLYLTALIGACWLEVSFALIDRDFLIPVMVVPLAFVLFAEPPPRGREPREDEPPTANVLTRSRSGLTGV